MNPDLLPVRRRERLFLAQGPSDIARKQLGMIADRRAQDIARFHGAVSTSLTGSALVIATADQVAAVFLLATMGFVVR